MDRDAGLRVAGHERALDRRRAAPARQQRRVDVQPEAALEQRLRDQQRRRRRGRSSSRRELELRRRPLRLEHGMPSRSAATFAGGAASLRPRPRGPVGPRQQRTRRRAARRAARARRRRTARSRRRASLTASPRRTGCGRSVAERLAARLVVVRSMISTPSRWSSSCWTTRASSSSSSSRTRLAVEVLALERDRRRALDRHEHALEREAALVVASRSSRSLDDLGVDDDDRVLVLVGLEDEEPLQDADLGRREADAVRVVHQRASSARRAARRSSSNCSTSRARIRSDRVGVLPDLREREAAARLRPRRRAPRSSGPRPPPLGRRRDAAVGHARVC